MLWDRSALNEEDGRCILSVDAARFHERAAELERIAAAKAYNRIGDVRPLGNSAALWSKVLLMAQAAYLGTLDDPECSVKQQIGDVSKREDVFRPLHALAGIECATSMVQFAVDVHSRDPGVLDEADRNGNLPLHVAASRRIQPLEYDYGQSDIDHGGAIVAILNAYPRAVRVANAAGRFPLNLAIESGASWNAGGIKHIFEHAPEALEARDTVTGLYPFMLAARVGSIEVSFLLLRHNPGLVSSGCDKDRGDMDLKSS